MAQSYTPSPTDRGPFPVPPEFHDRPVTASLVYLALAAADKPLTAGDLSETTGRPYGTMRHALEPLVEDGVVEKRRDLYDNRLKLYSLPD